MAHTYNASLAIDFAAETVFDSSVSPFASGSTPQNTRNVNGGRRWKAGGASGQIEAVYKRTRTVGSGATDSYNVLAAGALETPAGETIDLDELKAIVVKCTAGAIKVVGGTSNPVSCFTGSGQGVALSADQTFAMDLGPGGVDVTTNGTFEVVETSASASATYELQFIGAE